MAYELLRDISMELDEMMNGDTAEGKATTDKQNSTACTGARINGVTISNGAGNKPTGFTENSVIKEDHSVTGKGLTNGTERSSNSRPESNTVAEGMLVTHGAGVTGSRAVTHAATQNGHMKICDSFLRQGCPVRSIQHDVQVRGVTASYSEIFVIREHKAWINVYDTVSLLHVCDIIVHELKAPGAIVVCDKDKYLYISDWNHCCIYAVDLSNSVRVQWACSKESLNNGSDSMVRVKCSSRRWDTRGSWPRGLALTNENNLLATILEQFSNRGRIVEYARVSGEIVREVSMDESIKWPHQAVELSTGQMMISHGMGLLSFHRLCAIEQEGEILVTSDEKYETLAVDCPYSICKDNDDTIYVADCNNNRILMFNADLTYVGQVAALNDLYRPYRIFIDSCTSDRLYVTEVTTGRVLVVGGQH